MVVAGLKSLIWISLLPIKLFLQSSHTIFRTISFIYWLFVTSCVLRRQLSLHNQPSRGVVAAPDKIALAKKWLPPRQISPFDLGEASVPAGRRFFQSFSDGAPVAEHLPHHVWLYEPEYGVYCRRGEKSKVVYLVGVKLTRSLARTILAKPFISYSRHGYAYQSG